jgi:hypothetical protein
MKNKKGVFENTRPPPPKTKPKKHPLKDDIARILVDAGVGVDGHQQAHAI